MGSVAHLQSFLFKPGQSGNPAGRPVGSRVKLEAKFLDDLYETWLKSGDAVIAATVEKHPDRFLKIIADLMPNKLETAAPLAGLTVANIRTAIDALRSLADAGVIGAGAGTANEGEASNLPALPKTE